MGQFQRLGNILMMFVLCVLSCRQNNSKKKKFVIAETTMVPIKQDYTISWKDSSVVEFKLDGTISYPK